MKIFSANQIREWDSFTMVTEPISPIALMERASLQCTDWITSNFPSANSFAIFCGKGNNGGDGLAIARLLNNRQANVTIYILEFGFKGTSEFQENLARLHQEGFTAIHFIQDETHFPTLLKGTIIIDALLGSGLNRPLEGITAALAIHLNNAGLPIIAIDVPSGLYTDRSLDGGTCIKADHTLSFQTHKLAFMLAENAEYIGDVHLLDIGLHNSFPEKTETRFELIDTKLVRSIYKPRKRFTHKGNFGHALLVAGSYGKMGAAILAARACLRSGVGLLTCHIPSHANNIVQVSVSEAMVTRDDDENFITHVTGDLSRYSTIGVGPGIGTEAGTVKMLDELLSSSLSPMVIDADALNIIAENQGLLKSIPKGSILTPHPREFERLFGKTKNDLERIESAMENATALECVIVLKGHHTLVATGVKGYFNSTGNPGMATGGSGDVLTGMLTGLLAQGYSSLESALLGVYLHGLAGDLASAKTGVEALVAGDITDHIGNAFQVVAGMS